MANGKKISEQTIADSLSGNELIPFANNGTNGTVTADTIKEYAQDGLDDKYADKSDTYTKTEVDGLIDGVKGDMPTKVSELENDAKYQTESDVDGKLMDKVDKEAGKVLSSNDFTDEDKAKLDKFEFVLTNDDEIEDGLHQIASSEDYRSKLKERGYVVYHDVKFKVKDCGVTSDSFPWIVTEGAIITANAEGTLNDHTQKNVARSVYIWFDTILHYQPYNTSLENYDDSELRTAVDGKVDKVSGKGLSTNDFTDSDRTKLDGIEDGAQVNTVDSVNGRTGAVTGLAEASDIPTKVSELTNDSKFQTETQVKDAIQKVVGAAPDALDTLEEIADKLSDNDDAVAGIVTTLATKANKSEIPTKVSQLTNDSGYLTTHQDMSGKADKSEIPTKVSQLTNDLKYTTETQVENRLAILYESLDSQLVDEYTHLDNKKVDKVTGKGLSTNDYTTDDKDKLGALPTNAELTTTLATKADKTSVDTELSKKVDKVSGKQLSTEDFTTLLKQKLDGLTNYDDSTLTSELNALKSRLDTLVGSGDVTAVIDTFQEIENFLQGVTNTQTLTGLLQEMKSEIVALCADTYYPLAHTPLKLNDDLNDFKTTGLWGTTSSQTIPTLLNKPIELQNGECYLQVVNINGYGQQTFVNIRGNNKSTYVRTFTLTNFSNWHQIATTPIDGTSSQFLKADGSVDSTAYLPTASYTASDVLDKVKSVDGAGSGLDADLLDGKQPADLNVGSANKLYNVSTNSGTMPDIPENSIIYTTEISTGADGLFPATTNANSIISINRHNNNKTSSFRYESQIGVSSNGNLYYRAGGVPGITSLLATTPWKQIAFTDSNVASADKLTTKQLTNEDLNDIKDAYYSIDYFGSFGNTCSNKPNSVNQTGGFHFQCLNCGNNQYVQIFTEWGSGNQFKRSFNSSSWSPWQQLATTDGAVAKLTTKLLTNEDLNDLRIVGQSVYFTYADNTCANKPDGVPGGFQLIVNGLNQGYIYQTIMFNNSGDVYKRACVNNTWNTWQQIATTDGAVAKLTTKLLTNEDLNDVKDVDFSSYYAIDDNTCANKPLAGGFYLQVCGYNGATYIRQIYTSTNGIILVRVCTNNTWSPWKKMLTEDDIASLVSRIEALEARPTIASVDSLPSTPNNNTLYAIPE